MPETLTRKAKRQFRRRRHYKLLVSRQRWRLFSSWKITILVGYTSDKLAYLPDDNEQPLWSAVLAEVRGENKPAALDKANRLVLEHSPDQIGSIIIEDH